MKMTHETTNSEENGQQIPLAQKTDDAIAPQGSFESRNILKNLLCLAFAGHFLVFTAFDSLSNLQSTVNSKDGVGMASQAIIYAFFTISSFFLPTYIIRKFGCKNAIVVSVFSISLYIAANIFPRWETLIPSAVLCGLAFGPLWAARSTYVNEISHRFSAMKGARIAVVNAWFFGVCSFFHENAEIWGNVISYFVLRSEGNNSSGLLNQTDWTCGSSFCSYNDLNPNLEPPSFTKRYTLCVIYLSLILIAGFVLLFALDPLDRINENRKISFDLMNATFKHCKNKNQLLLLPLTFYCGLVDGFYNSDFTKSYIACSWGISQVGFVTISYGVACAVMDCISGHLVKYFTRVTVFFIGAASHICMLTACLFWEPTADNPSMFFILSGVHGLGASVWWTQIVAFYGIVFKNDEDAAFSNFYFWSSLGLLMAYAYSNHVCTFVKIYILLILLVVSISAYTFVEIKVANHSKITKNSTSRALSVSFQKEDVTQAMVM